MDVRSISSHSSDGERDTDGGIEKVEMQNEMNEEMKEERSVKLKMTQLCNCKRVEMLDFVKGMLPPEMKIPSSFSRTHVVPNSSLFLL